MANEVLVLNRIGDPDDRMFSCDTGTIDGYGVKSIAAFGEQRRIRRYINSYLRKTGKSLDDFNCTESLLIDFIQYLEEVEIEVVE